METSPMGLRTAWWSFKIVSVSIGFFCPDEEAILMYEALVAAAACQSPVSPPQSRKPSQELNQIGHISMQSLRAYGGALFPIFHSWSRRQHSQVRFSRQSFLDIFTLISKFIYQPHRFLHPSPEIYLPIRSVSFVIYSCQCCFLFNMHVEGICWGSTSIRHTF